MKKRKKKRKIQITNNLETEYLAVEHSFDERKKLLEQTYSLQQQDLEADEPPGKPQVLGGTVCKAAQPDPRIGDPNQRDHRPSRRNGGGLRGVVCVLEGAAFGACGRFPVFS